MADYSRYGTPSDEWLEYVPYNPRDLFAKGLGPEVADWPIEKIVDLQKLVNDTQDARAAKVVKATGTSAAS